MSVNNKGHIDISVSLHSFVSNIISKICISFELKISSNTYISQISTTSNPYFNILHDDLDIMLALYTFIKKFSNHTYLFDKHKTSIWSHMLDIQTYMDKFDRITIDNVMYIRTKLEHILILCIHCLGYNILFRYGNKDITLNNTEAIQTINTHDIRLICDETNVPCLEIIQLSTNTFMMLCFDMNIHRKENILRYTLYKTATLICGGNTSKHCHISGYDEDTGLYQTTTIQFIPIVI